MRAVFPAKDADRCTQRARSVVMPHFYRVWATAVLPPARCRGFPVTGGSMSCGVLEVGGACLITAAKHILELCGVVDQRAHAGRTFLHIHDVDAPVLAGPFAVGATKRKINALARAQALTRQ
jgi:hypothetical protein